MNFKSYIQIRNNTYMELFGLAWEDFQTGQVFTHRPGITISQQDNKEEATDTINSAQLHYDASYANTTEWKKCLGVSTMTVQRLIGMTSKTFFRKHQITGFDSISMTHPVFDGDTLYSETTILEKSPYTNNANVGQLKVQTIGTNQHGDVVSKLIYDVTIFKKGCHPIELELKGDYSEVTEDKFNGFSTTKDGKLKEEVGIFFEDLNIGETYLHQPGKTITEQESLTHSLRSLDWNPLYIDTNLSSKHLDEGDILMNPSFLLSAATACTTRTCGRVVANLAWENIQFVNEVKAGDTIYSETTILEKRESHSRPDQGIMKVETRTRNQNGDIVISYERTFLIYKTGKGPYGHGMY
ncbi:MAG: MaoC/PaaZ C-terminal domain-containing protein [Hyphomicrobiales bacterium]